MKTAIIAIISLLNLGNFALAQEPDAKDKPVTEEVHHGPGQFVNLSSTQKESMRNEHFKFEDKRIDLESAIEHARLNFEKVSSNQKSDDSDIRKASEELASAQNKKTSAEDAFKADLLIKVFKPEQRAAALRCGMMMDHAMGPHQNHPGDDKRHKDFHHS
jgi:hypothetical protein